MRTEIAYKATIYLDSINAEDKLLKQKLFEYFCIYFNVGTQG